MTTALKMDTTNEAPTRRLTIHAIADDILALDALLEETEGEVTPEIEAWLEENAENLTKKTDGIARYVRSLEARKAAIEGERKAILEDAAHLQKRATTMENKRRSMLGLVERVMLRVGREKWEGEVFTLSRQKNGGVAPVTFLVAPALLPKHMKRQIPARYVADSESARSEVKLTAATEPDRVVVNEDGSQTLLAEVEKDGQKVLTPVCTIAGPTYSVRIR